MGGEKIIKFCNYYTRMVSEAKYESVHGEWSKISTPKQILQRLPIALPPVKAYKNLLNNIREIIHSLYRAKQITKKVYNNIMNSIKL